MRYGSCAPLLALAVAFVPRASHAGSDKAAAEALFQEGQAALDAGRTAEACPKLAESLRLDKAIGTLLNLARCHELEGKTATAWAEYREASELAEKAGQTDRAKGAAEFALKLEGMLSRLRIEAPHAAPGLTIKRDSIVVGPGALGTFVPIDPGEHTITVTAPGYSTWSAKIAIRKDGDQATVTVPPLVKTPEHAGRGASGKDEETMAGDTSPARRTAGFVLGGIGVAGLAAGAVLGAMTLSDVRNAEEDPSLCPNKVCSPAGRAKVDGAAAKGWGSTIALGVGAASLGVGTVLVVTSFSRSAASSAQKTGLLRVEPWIGPSLGGFAASGAF